MKSRFTWSFPLSPWITATSLWIADTGISRLELCYPLNVREGVSASQSLRALSTQVPLGGVSLKSQIGSPLLWTMNRGATSERQRGKEHLHPIALCFYDIVFYSFWALAPNSFTVLPLVMETWLTSYHLELLLFISNTSLKKKRKNPSD